jgi:hypothetical protein
LILLTDLAADEGKEEDDSGQRQVEEKLTSLENIEG